MLRLAIWPDAVKFLESIERKHAGQITLKVFALLDNPNPPDSQPVQGTNEAYLRADIGEYRIIYRVEGEQLLVPLIGRRNDDDVYKQMKRKKL